MTIRTKHHRRPHLRDIHFRMAVTQSNKKRNQPVDASERLAYLYANPTISFYNPIQPESIMPLSIFKRLFICFCFALLTALPAQAEEQKNGTLPPALETALSTLLADAPQVVLRYSLEVLKCFDQIYIRKHINL